MKLVLKAKIYLNTILFCFNPIMNNIYKKIQMAHLYLTIHITLEQEEVLNISIKMHTKLT